MKVKLLLSPVDYIDPSSGKQIHGGFIPPFGLATLTAYLRQHNITVNQDDLDVKVAIRNERGRNPIDLSVFSDQERILQFSSQGREETLEAAGEQILKLTSLRNCDIVGLSVGYLDMPSSIATAMVLGKMIKQRYGATVLFGGSFDTYGEEKLLAGGSGDYGIIASCDTALGEINLLNFCRAFEEGKDLKSIPGVKYYEAGKVHSNWREYPNDEKYGMIAPTFDGLPLDLYRRKVRVGVPSTFKALILPYSFVRGCPYKCAFCCNSTADYWATKEPSTIATELRELSGRYHTPYFLFLNPLVNPTYGFAKNLAEELTSRDLDIKWTDCASFHQMDRPLLKKLKEAGAVRLTFGFESASPSVLRSVKKPFTVNRGVSTLKAAYDVGIGTELDLICGLPYERDEDTAATITFIKENHKYITAINLNKFRVDGLIKRYPGKFGIEFFREGDALHRDWSVLRYREVQGLDYEERFNLTNNTYERIRAVIDTFFMPPPPIQQFFFYCEDKAWLDTLKKENYNRICFGM